jgi:hypothetical protein
MKLSFVLLMGVVLVLLCACFPGTGSPVEREQDIGFSEAELRAVLDAAEPYDIIEIPPSSFTVHDTITIDTEGITIVGAGKDATIINNASGNKTVFVIAAPEVTISHLTMKGNEGLLVPDHFERRKNPETRSWETAILIGMAPGGWPHSDAKDFHICNVAFNNFGLEGISVSAYSEKAENNYGLIHYCDFNYTHCGVGVAGSNSDKEWNDTLEESLGTHEAVFVEDCTFKHFNNCIGSGKASKYVFRYNDVDADNSLGGVVGVDAHGLEYNSVVGGRGSRSYEVYENTFINNVGTRPRIINIRGGDGVIHNNTFSREQEVFIELHNKQNGATKTTPVPNETKMIGIGEANGPKGEYPTPDQTTKLYVWNNTANGAPVDEIYVNELSDEYFDKDRDYFYHEPDFTYTPYQYPHPLAQPECEVGK